MPTSTLEKPTTVKFKSRAAALAALKAAEHGEAVIRALNLVANTATMEEAVRDMRRQIG